MSTSTIPLATEAKGQDEEGLRNQLLSAMQSLKRREPLDPTYKRLLMNGIVTSRRPVLPSKDKTYKRIGSNLRSRVESFMDQTQGKDPFDRISQRQPLQEDHMRAALTLREAKKHEQKALLEVTLSALPKRNGMDATTRRRHLEGIALGLQSSEKKPTATRPRTPPPPSAIHKTEQARQKAELELQKAQALAREKARQRRDEEERKKRDDELKRKSQINTPQQALHKVYQPIFKALWEMEFPFLSGTNPFRIVIDRENCASCGAPDYFDGKYQCVQLCSTIVD